MVGFRIDKRLRDLLEVLAAAENRTLSNFIETSIIIFLKEHKGIDVGQTFLDIDPPPCADS